MARMLALLPADRPAILEVIEAVTALPELAPVVAPPARPWRWGLGGALAGLSLLLALLRGPTPDLPSDAAGQRGRAVAVLGEALGAPAASLRAEAAGAVGQGRDPLLRDLLAPRLEDPDAEVRAAAAAGLGQLGAQQDVGALLRAAQRDPAPLVQVAAAGALLALHRPEGQVALQQALSGGPAAALQAALRLDEAGDPAARGLLREWRSRFSLDDKLRLRVLSRLALDRDADAVEELREMMAGGSAPMRLSAAAALGRVWDEPAREALRRAARASGPQQVQAARLLAALGDSGGYELLRAAVQDPKQAQATRVLAAEGLAACGRREAVAALWGALGPRSDPLLRVAAAEAVLVLAEDDPTGLAAQGLSWARAALGERQWTVREDAVAVLEDLDQEEAVALLGRALRDDRPEVRRSAARALGRRRAEAALQQLCRGWRTRTARYGGR